jgi:hypothetical protein
MSQEDYTIDNASGAAVRADLNSTLAAVVSANSGATQPATMYPYQVWADTTANKLKIRNGANNAWYEVGTLDTANLGLMLASFFPNINSNVTATDEELNKLDGLTATTTELNLLSGKTAIPTAADAYPIGSIYMNASNSANPASLLGFGTWVSFGSGRVLTGLDSSQSEFNSIGETGGAKTSAHTLTKAQLPNFGGTLSIDGWVHGNGDFTDDTETGRYLDNTTATRTGRTTTLSVGSGNSHSHSTLQPYIVVYMWKRTA